MTDFDIRIDQDILRNGIAIVVFDKRHNDSRVVNLYTGETKILKEYEEIPQEFIMKLSNTVANEFLLALAEALDNCGIKTNKDAKIQGLLEATKYHLEDMRTIALINYKPVTEAK